MVNKKYWFGINGLKMSISTSVWSAQHPNIFRTGRNIQQTSVEFLKQSFRGIKQMTIYCSALILQQHCTTKKFGVEGGVVGVVKWQC